MEPRVYSDPQCVTVTLIGGALSAGTAGATHMGGGEWYLNRVIVRPEHRGKGYGKVLVTRLLAETTKQGCTKMVLTPGGYDLTYEEQEAFYLKCGFRVVGEGLLNYP